MEIGNIVESDHQLVKVEIGVKKEKEIESCKQERKEIVEWGEENIELYRRRGETRRGEDGGTEYEGDMGKLEERSQRM